jgi:hypothetical protein
MTLATNQDIVKAFGLEGLRVTEFTLHAVLEELPLVTITRRVSVGELETVRFELHNRPPVETEHWLDKRAREAHEEITMRFDEIAERVVDTVCDYGHDLRSIFGYPEKMAIEFDIRAFRKKVDRLRPPRWASSDWGGR